MCCWVVQFEYTEMILLQGVVDVLCEACERMKWSAPTPMQRQAIPAALLNKDIIGLAETGSGKTGAFALPILQVCFVTLILSGITLF